MTELGKRENLADVITYMGDVVAAAERLQIEPSIVAKRIVASLDLEGIRQRAKDYDARRHPPNPPYSETLGQMVAEEVKKAARAL